MPSLTDLPELVGFFSYSREDDEGSHGALSMLRERIQHELRAQLGRTAKTFRLWQDKEAIPSGTLWESEINNSVAQSVFFIPIITPTVIASPYCKFELETFLAREAELGRDDLVFPILYIDVPALEDSAERKRDPVLSLIAKRQYVDWREFRYLDVNSTEVRRAIGRFCTDIRNALRRPWVSPEERKAQEEAAQRAQQEAVRRAEEQAARRAEEEAARNAQQAAARRQDEVERQRRITETKRREKEQRARKAELASSVTQPTARALDHNRGEQTAFFIKVGIGIAALLLLFGAVWLGGHLLVPTHTTDATQKNPPPTEAATPATAFYEEEQPGSAQAKRYTGTVDWRTENVSAGPALPPDLSVRADLIFPDRKLTTQWSLRRNTDKALPARHTIEIIFTLPSDFPSGGISSVPSVMMKQSEQARGVPLSGISVKVMNGYFLVGLSTVDADMQRNLELLKNYGWFEVPIVLETKRRDALTFSKGSSGQRAFEEAFKAWGQ